MSAQGQAGAPKEDYLDKGVDAVEKKFGQGKINPEQSRGVNEKITDGIRGVGEKLTGLVLAFIFVLILSLFLCSHGMKRADVNT
ncbi:hypothetical protein MMC07_003835 [Pseudocyphellaria aurata]|nr:hypothetical protein [Pseudocyphellaria aurata]